MKDGQSHSTLREWRDHMMRPRAVAIFAGLAVILTLIAPFGAERATGPLLRFCYWLLIVVLTYATGYLAHCFALVRYARQPVLHVAISMLITAAGANLVVFGVNLLILSDVPAGLDLLRTIVNISVIAMIIAGIFHLLPDEPAMEEARRHCALMDRLPLEKRGPLVALSVEDHYVRIRTLSGEDVLLMRLSDAIRETGDINGLQVHRSHWVALDQVKTARRRGDGAMLQMNIGPDIPVSRSNLPAVRKAGLLPR